MLLKQECVELRQVSYACHRPLKPLQSLPLLEVPARDLLGREPSLRHAFVVDADAPPARGRQREHPLEDRARARQVDVGGDHEQLGPPARLRVHQPREHRVADRVEAPRLEEKARRGHAALEKVRRAGGGLVDGEALGVARRRLVGRAAREDDEVARVRLVV
eukprot:CAMPEP_0182846460 /NCGR_PEP_ID=MMETSP0006_2-20121128/27907_1 /TAXON_ID=97485 /ORGANISM="Prymnesium parvum, Strain Texoma1" /LENGTH=161 /DNA_ID=CAMNT_0024976669 /DNA_START=240 /DNA_END=722 /DNA_ORIENTATION=-